VKPGSVLRHAAPILGLALVIGIGITAAPPQPAVAQEDSSLVPATRAELHKWLQAGKYKEFPHESEVHPSDGPHGDVQTYLNPILEASLKAGNEAHPVNAAAVKELYGSDGKLSGWAVSVKTQVESADGDGWYWYETFSTADDADAAADGKGVGLCTGCHAGGTDYVTIPYPLR
jgi:hypothetical protein